MIRSGQSAKLDKSITDDIGSMLGDNVVLRLRAYVINKVLGNLNLGQKFPNAGLGSVKEIFDILLVYSMGKEHKGLRMAEVYGHKRLGVKSCFISWYLVTVPKAPLTLLSALALLLNDLGGVKVSPNICFLFHTFRITRQQLIWLDNLLNS